MFWKAGTAGGAGGVVYIYGGEGGGRVEGF